MPWIKCSVCPREVWRKPSQASRAVKTYCSKECKDGDKEPPESRFSRYLGKQTEAGCIPWTGAIDKDGYGVFWSGNYEEGYVKAHRFAYKLKHGDYPTDLGCHTCNNPSCVNADHVYDGSRFDNAADKVAAGNSLRGEKNPNRKLTEAQVIEIRSRHKSGVGTSQLGREYGVSSQLIGHIVYGKSWKYLLQPPRAREGQE